MSKDLFKAGDIVRYAAGKTGLMQIEDVRAPHGNSRARYYGEHCLGGVTGAYHETVSPAQPADLETWERHAAQRAESAD